MFSTRSAIFLLQICILFVVLLAEVVQPSPVAELPGRNSRTLTAGYNWKAGSRINEGRKGTAYTEKARVLSLPDTKSAEEEKENPIDKKERAKNIDSENSRNTEVQMMDRFYMETYICSFIMFSFELASAAMDAASRFVESISIMDEINSAFSDWYDFGY